MKLEEASTDRDMLKVLMGQGVSAADAKLALEMCQHAKKQAMESLKVVSLTAPPHLQLLVSALAMDSLAACLQVDTVEDQLVRTMALGIILAAHESRDEGQMT